MTRHSTNLLVTCFIISILFVPRTIAIQSVVSTQGEVLDITLNLRMTGASTTTRTVSHVAKCMLVCLRDTQCLSVSYNTVTDVCHLNNVNLNSPDIVVAYNTNYIFSATSKDITNWHMVFRGTQGMGATLFDSWNNQGHDDMDAITSASIGCLSVDGRLPCDRHFRSRRLDDWHNIEKVKFELYTDAQSVFHVTFNATGSISGSDVFNIRNIIDSSVSELIGYSGTYNFGSDADGHPLCCRRFYLSVYHNGCNNDRGWLMINDGEGDIICCSYERPDLYPQFMYTKTGSHINWISANDVGYAQVFAVFIKYSHDN